MTLKISQLTPVAAGSLDGSEPVELGIAGDKSAPNGAFLPPGYIEGLKMQWVSGTAITITSGAAYIPSLGRVVRSAAAIAKTALVLTASTWYHVYLYINAGAAAIEIVTTTPSAVYFGSARSKNADTSRRYLGSVRTDSAGNILQFKHFADVVTYALGSSNMVVNSGTATAVTDFDCSAFAPVTATDLFMRAQMQPTSANGDYGYVFDKSASTSSGGAQLTIGAVANCYSNLHSWVSYDPSLGLSYQSHAGSPLYLWVMRYRFER